MQFATYLGRIVPRLSDINASDVRIKVCRTVTAMCKAAIEDGAARAGLKSQLLTIMDFILGKLVLQEEPSK